MSIPPSSSTSQQFTYAASTSATVANGAYFPTPFHLQQSETYPKPYVAPPPTVMAPVYPPAPIGPVYSLPQYQQVSNSTFVCWISVFVFEFCLLGLFILDGFVIIAKTLCEVWSFCVLWSGFWGNGLILRFNWVFLWWCENRVVNL
jgi:hypothetical protein